MAIKEFLDNYRDHIVSLSLLEYKNRENIEELEKYSINYINKRKLNTLVNNVSFLDNSLELIKLDIEKMFYNFYLKLDKLEKLSEGYQKLNTNEASENFIEDFTTFEIKDRNLYDNFLEGLSLPRKHQIKNLLAKSIERNKINVTETYKLPDKIVDTLLRVNILDSSNTLLKRVSFIDRNNNEIVFISNQSLIEIPKNTYKIEVHTDNINTNNFNFTSLDLMKMNFYKSGNTVLDDKVFRKAGNLFKLVIDYDLPEECKCTLKLNIKSNEKGKLKNEVVYFNLYNNSEVLLEDNTASETFTFVKEYSTDESYIKYLGNKVFDISKITAEEFTVTLSISVYNLINDLESPIIRGIFGYVTN